MLTGCGGVRLWFAVVIDGVLKSSRALKRSVRAVPVLSGCDAAMPG